jgi:hypothetical protein
LGWYGVERCRRCCGARAAPLQARAAPVALAVGLATAILIWAAHLLPRGSPFRDPFPGSGFDALWWAAVLTEIAVALAFAAAGAYSLRESLEKRLGWVEFSVSTEAKHSMFTRCGSIAF